MAVQNLKSKIDWFIINKVREFRLAKKLGQIHLAVQIGKSLGYIGQIESPKSKSRYNTDDLNALAKLFKCSPKDFWPEKAL